MTVIEAMSMNPREDELRRRRQQQQQQREVRNSTRTEKVER